MKNEEPFVVEATVVETTEKNQNSKNDVKIIKLDPTKKLDLSKYDPQQIEKAKEISKSLSVEDTNSILNYGIELQSKLSNYSSEILSNVRNIDTGEMGEVVQDLLSELNMIKIEEPKNALSRVVKRPAIPGRRTGRRASPSVSAARS